MSDTTYLSFYLQKSEILVFHRAVLALGTPKCIQFRVHVDGTSMLMEPCEKKTFTSFRVPKIEENDGIGRMRVYSKGLCMLIANKLNWDINRSYRIPGKVMTNQKLVVFDLTEATEIDGNRQ